MRYVITYKGGDLDGQSYEGDTAGPFDTGFTAFHSTLANPDDLQEPAKLRGKTGEEFSIVPEHALLARAEMGGVLAANRQRINSTPHAFYRTAQWDNDGKQITIRFDHLRTVQQ